MARRVIDIHNHPNWHGHDVDALVRNMDEHGIEKTWLLSWEISREEFNAAPVYHEHMDPRGLCAPLWMVVEGLHRHPTRFIGGWAPDPRDRYVRARIKAAVKIHGIKVYGELKSRMRYDDPDAIAVYRYCGKIGLPVLFHLENDVLPVRQFDESIQSWPEWYGGDIGVVDTMCRLCPDTKFIGHAPGFWRAISGDSPRDGASYPKGPVKPGGTLVKLLRKHKNLHCDLSAGSGANALERDLKHARKFVLEFQDRIMFGRDFFDRRQFNVLEKLDLADKVLDKVYCDNAERIIADAGKNV